MSNKQPPKLPNVLDLQSVADQYPHPGVSLYKQYIAEYTQLDQMDQALHKVAHTKTYENYCLAKKYGHQIHNIFTNGGLNVD